jgi:hypothetical protein
MATWLFVVGLMFVFNWIMEGHEIRYRSEGSMDLLGASSGYSHLGKFEVVGLVWNCGSAVTIEKSG